MTEARTRADRTHRLGVLVNLALAAGKLGVGLVAGSTALTADGLHSLSDVLANAGAWVGFRLAQKPADADHHYGHGNVESVVSLVFGLIMIGTGAGAIGFGFTGGHTDPSVLGYAALSVAGASIAVKLWLARVTSRAARDANSASLRAVSRDNLADAATGAVAFVGIGGSLLGASWTEAVAAVVVGGFVVWMGLTTAREGFDVLMDRMPDTELPGRIETAARTVDGVLAAHQVRVHPIGSELSVDLVIEVDGDLTVRAAHDVADAVEAAITAEVPAATDVVVHVEPAA